MVLSRCDSSKNQKAFANISEFLTWNPGKSRQCPLWGLFLNGVHYSTVIESMSAECQLRLWGYWDDQSTLPALLDSVRAAQYIAFVYSLEEITPSPRGILSMNPCSLAGRNSCLLLWPTSWSCLEVEVIKFTDRWNFSISHFIIDFPLNCIVLRECGLYGSDHSTLWGF